MKHFFTLFFLVIVVSAKAQIVHYNQFPTLTPPPHVLDDKLTDISFALSMRVLVSDYNGPLVKLRRSSDNALQDFYAGDNDIVNIDEIITWASGANLYIHTWHDQSGLDRDAIQTSTNLQPAFEPNPTQPYFKGDGSNDFLIIDTPNGLQDLITNGNEGSLLFILKPLPKYQYNFGVFDGASGVNRWSAHIAWADADNHIFFDPGSANNDRSYKSVTDLNTFTQFTFIKAENDKFIMRDSGIERLNGSKVSSTNSIKDFYISAANGAHSYYTSITPFVEFIMYKKSITSNLYKEIEENQMTFWGL